MAASHGRVQRRRSGRSDQPGSVQDWSELRSWRLTPLLVRFAVGLLCQTFLLPALFPDRSPVCRVSRIREVAARASWTHDPRRRECCVHLCTAEDWRRAQEAGERRPPSLDAVGFVHLSAPEQVHLPANRLYAGRTDMVLLRCDPASLGAPVRWEPGVPSDPAAMLFPHLYGPLPAAAVTSVTPYLPGADGTFARLPGSVRSGDVGVDLDLDEQSGAMSADTSTMVATGRMSPNTSACTAATSSHRLMSVTNIRVRTTSVIAAPASCQRHLDAAEGFPGLGGHAVTGRRRSRDHDERSDAYRPRVAHPVLERRSRRDGDAALRHGANDIGLTPASPPGGSDKKERGPCVTANA